MNFLQSYPEFKNFYDGVGFAGRVGFGERPAVIVIDLALAWTDPNSSMGTDMTEAIEQTLRILRVARRVKPKIPTLFTVMAYDSSFNDVASVLLLKLPVIKTYLLRDNKWTKIDPRLEREADEVLIEKKYPSCFHGTHLNSLLVSKKVDTLIITGCSTSSCVRCTAADAVSYGYHTIVPFDAVADRDPTLAKYALIDIDIKFGDVLSTDDVVRYLSNFKS